RRAVDHGVLVADQSAGSFRFRHALLAEAIYATILPGEREELHARLADELARTGAASPAELAPHWAAAGRAAEALQTSVEAARQAAAVFGLAEAHGHLERALAVWDTVPDATALAGVDLAELCAWAAAVASDIGAAPRAVELARRSIDLVGAGAPHRAAFLTVRLGEYLYEVGRDDEALAALERAVALAPAEPPSPERAYALSSLAGGLMVARRNAKSLPLAEQALALARAVGANEAEVRALTVLAADLVYLGRGDAGLAHYREALQLAEEVGDLVGLARVYINFTDALTMLGRNREAAQLAETGLEVMRRHGVDSTLIAANRIEALLQIGDWDAADRESAAAVRGISESFPDALLILRALLETGRGEFDAAHVHFDAASETTRPDRGHGLLDGWIAELALWERRWEDAAASVTEGLGQASGSGAAHIRVFVSATGLRAQAELAALARARRDTDDLHGRLDRARKLLATARRAAASSITPTSTGWLAQANAEHARALGAPRPELWRAASETWDRLDRSPLAAYCRWRQAEALVGAGASRAEASAPLRDAHAVTTRLAAKPLLAELELLAQRARLELAVPEAASHVEQQRVEEALGLTRREAEVLALVARGYTNREIAGELVISVKTASVHVSNILRKLGAPSRQEAAAISHRFAPTK
ncbi:MAG TPA: LuxR C-terminal-related transcriptional regulator, partial [Gaiellaceae bacterium]|nr:LuxR C-terminal-related transcriptional regulator [Gaiellaceae bacterium]